MIAELSEKATPEYKTFSAKLVPGVDSSAILGVRVPDIKALAKAIVKKGGYEFFLCEKHELEKLLPQIDNWASCDVVAAALKAVRKNSDLFYAKCLEWLNSASAYTVRFAVVILLNYYLDKDFRREVPALLAAFDSGEYYVNMAIAWYFSAALVKQYDETIGIFESGAIKNVWVHNKSIQKALESYRISSDKKNYIKSLKRKV